MQFVSALLEHFVVGALSLIWILPLLDGLGLTPDIDHEKYKEIVVVFAVPAAYVLGMYIDLLASPITGLIKRLLHKPLHCWAIKELARLVRASKGASYARTIRIIRGSTDESAKYLQLLTGREKIARGVFLNLLFTSGVNAWHPSAKYGSLTLLLLVTLFALLAWLRLNSLTDAFKDEFLQVTKDDQR